MKTKDILIWEELLRGKGYRVTTKRILLLVALSRSKKPLTVGELQKETGHCMDKVTLYRALEDFATSKIVVRVNLNDSAAYYELLHKDHHHHHIVCEKCGKIEDIKHCKQTNLQKETLKHSKNFSIINSHSLEFFGLCKSCNKK